MNPVFFGKNDISNRLITSTETVIAFPAYMPIVPGHVLVCPKRIVATLEELSADEKIALFEMVAQMKQALTKCFGAQGFNMAWNQGGIAGQTVDHLHIHILPRTKGDTGITQYEPRDFLYRPGVRDITPDEELEEVARSIADCL